MENDKLISILIPAYNEEENIVLIHKELKKVLSSYNYEIIFVDDGSTDDTEKVLESLAKEDDKVRYLQFSRNFGKESAISAGLDMANGCAVLTIDADMQHPVELIPEFIKRWENGFDVVVGVRNKNKGEGFVKKFGSFMFYKIMNVIGETKITPRATDFRLLDRKVVLAFRRFTEHERMARGLIDWLGFKRDYVYFDANARMKGKVAYNNMKLFKLAFSSMIAHSLFPLKLAGYMGALITSVFGGFGAYLMFCKYILRNDFGRSFTGSAQLAILNIFLIGLVLSSLGLIALYIANIKAEVANRPTYVIRKKNFK
ncbi:MAG: glycosyltransferase family 2 protein [Minisyncoccus archaeiphilus]|jgi:dolichol-phosphate mannosyltransferase|uniref:glycosyltransferase family 2 protein n=1 Tax=Minisyncoccus archaeiphilus TaxID=3238481 RepID=UPI002B0C70DA|nr:MAG: glycosyltransferase family 2 protein [Candidatus Parcubacteria bacterium]